jgi:hypothetical protein
LGMEVSEDKQDDNSGKNKFFHRKSGV